MRAGVEVHVLTRGGARRAASETVAGVVVHRVPEDPMPRDLDAFVAWVEGMNSHMHAAGRQLGRRVRFDVVHGHDWLVAGAAAALADRLRFPYLTTIHATEYGRHQGWVDKHPQSYIHGIETWMAGRADRIVTCSHYMRGHVADVFAIDEERVTVIPNGIDCGDLHPVDDLAALRARFADPADRLVLLVGRLVYEKGFQLALDALPQVIRRCGPRALPRRRVGDARGASCASRRARSASWSTARSWAGSATTSCTRCTGSPTSAWCRASTSRSASSRSRRWRAAARASSPTPAACARSSRTPTSACASARATRARSRR